MTKKILSKEERMRALANAKYTRSEPGRVRDYQSMARPIPREILEALAKSESITCEKPTGPLAKLMSDQPEGVHPPFPLFPGHVRRQLVEIQPLPPEAGALLCFLPGDENSGEELHHLSMGCRVDEPNPCPLCEAQDAEEEDDDE